MNTWCKSKRNHTARTASTFKTDNMSSRQPPTHFVAFRLQSESFAAAVSQLQQTMVHESRSPHLKKCLTSTKKLHFTCFVLSLIDSQKLNLAMECFESLRSDIQSMMSVADSPKLVLFEKLATFNTKVLYAEAADCPTLSLLHEIDALTKHRFSQPQFRLDDCLPNEMQQPWCPHVTIAKTSADRNNRRLKITEDDFDELQHFVQHEPALVASLDLLSMADVDADGYYKRCATIDLL